MDRVRRLTVALIVLAVAGLVVLVVTVRPGLREKADGVDRSWKPLVTPLDARYQSLTALRDALTAPASATGPWSTGLDDARSRTGRSPAPGPTSTTRSPPPTSSSPSRPAPTRSSTPHACCRTPTLGTAFTNFAKTEPQKQLLDDYNHRVMEYQGDRDGFWSRIVARLDGYDMRPTLQLVTA